MIKRLFSAVLAAFFVLFTAGFNTAVQAAVLSSETPILVKAEKIISEDTVKEGSNVKFTVVNAVTDQNGSVVLEEGAPVKGVVTLLEPKKRIGRRASIAVTNFTAVLNNGSKIDLTGRIDRISESRMARSIVLSVLICPLFLLMRGAAPEIQEGTQVKLYPAADYEVIYE